MNHHLRNFILLAAATAAVSLNLLIALAAQGQAPTVTTMPATNVTASNATLQGTVNPNGLATTAYYQYGLDTNYGDIGVFTSLQATDANLMMPGFVASAITGVAGNQWIQASTPITNWYSIASSADGTHLAAVVAGVGIYTSTNGGVAWAQSSAPSKYWTSITSSADGTHLIAVDGSFGSIWGSIDGGLSWTQSSAPSEYWSSIVSSADGTGSCNLVLHNSLMHKHQ